MNKSLLALTIAASLALTGCGNDAKVEGKVQYEDYIVDSLNADTKIVFDVLSAPILPTFLAMDTTDGTLSTEGKVGEEGYSTDLTDPQTALGKVDGWSTTQPIILPFDGLINETSAQNAVYLFETNKPSSPGKAATIQGKMGRLKTNQDYVVKVINDAVKKTSNVVIIPIKPLNPKSDYMFAVTNELEDANGETVGMSPSYAMFKTAVKAPNESLATGQQYTHGIEATFDTQGLDAKSIIYSSWFSTGSVGETLYATKAAIASGIVRNGIASIWKGTANPNKVDLTEAYSITATSTDDFATVLKDDTNFTKFLEDTDGSQKASLIALYNAYTPGTVNVTKGTVKLPYYLEKGEKSWNSTPFQSAMPSLAIVSKMLKDETQKPAVAAQLLTAGIDVTKLATDPREQLKMIGLSLVDASGQPLDSERLITQYSPVPQVKSLEKVPYLLFTPAVASAEKSLPVVIYQHGITSVKENSYAFAANLLKKGVAVLAIDNPLHGERRLDEKRSANTDIQAYLNLTRLPVARDNIRQSMLDINGLRTALSVSDLTSNGELKLLDYENVSFLGHSLGGVVGAPAVVAANRTLGQGDSLDKRFSFKSSAFANSGSDIGNLLFGSEAFGSMIKHNLMYKSSTEYQTYAKANCTNTNEENWEKGCFEDFEKLASNNVKSEMDTTFNKFIYAAQTIVGTADPINAAWLANHNVAPDGTSAPVLNNHPMYMLQVSGDDTVPNHVRLDENDPRTTLPFTGTEKMAAFFGLQSFTSTTNGKSFAKFKADKHGTHKTFITPGEGGLTAPDYATYSEMHKQLGDFFSSPTGVITATDGFLED